MRNLHAFPQRMGYVKIYTPISRATARIMALDHPIGDPTGGPAYGERNDPISAAVSIVGMVAGSFAATAANATLGAMVFGGMAMAGGALSLIGNVSGNRSLMKIGGIVGGIGGLGLAAGGLGMFDLTSGTNSAMAASAAAGEGVTPAQALDMSLANPAAVDLANATPMAVQTGGTAAAGLTQDAALANALGQNAAPAAGAASSAEMSADSALSNAFSQSSAPAVDANMAAAGASSAPAVTAPADSSIASWNRGMDFGSQSSTPWVTDTSNGFGAGGPRFTGNDFSSAWNNQLAKDGLSSVSNIKPPGFLDQVKNGDYLGAAQTAGKNVMDLAKSNPGAALMLGNAVTGIADQLSGKTDAEINSYLANSNLGNAKADEIRRAIEIERERRARLNAGYAQVNQGVNVNPGISMAQRPPGLIAGARPAGG